MTSLKTLALALTLASITLGQACEAASKDLASSAATAHRHANADIVETASRAGHFTTLVAAVKAAGLVDTLKGEGPFTVFAPTDDAFKKLPAGTVENLLRPENQAKLVAILGYHVVPGRLAAADVTSRSGALTVNGQRLGFKTNADAVTVDGATVTKADLVCSNGIIHVIDRVVLPTEKTIVEVAAGAGTFGTLLAAAKAADLAETLGSKGPFTVFAPTDEAFAKLPAGTVESLLRPENKAKLAKILSYHVVAGRIDSTGAAKAGKASPLAGGALTITPAGQTLAINGAKVVTADVNAVNGIVHVIDSVLLPE